MRSAKMGRVGIEPTTLGLGGLHLDLPQLRQRGHDLRNVVSGRGRVSRCLTGLDSPDFSREHGGRGFGISSGDLAEDAKIILGIPLESSTMGPEQPPRAEQGETAVAQEVRHLVSVQAQLRGEACRDARQAAPVVAVQGGDCAIEEDLGGGGNIDLPTDDEVHGKIVGRVVGSGQGPAAASTAPRTASHVCAGAACQPSPNGTADQAARLSVRVHPRSF